MKATILKVCIRFLLLDSQLYTKSSDTLSYAKLSCVKISTLGHFRIGDSYKTMKNVKTDILGFEIHERR